MNKFKIKTYIHDDDTEIKVKLVQDTSAGIICIPLPPQYIRPQRTVILNNKKKILLKRDR